MYARCPTSRLPSPQRWTEPGETDQCGRRADVCLLAGRWPQRPAAEDRAQRRCGRGVRYRYGPSPLRPRKATWVDLVNFRLWKWQKGFFSVAQTAYCAFSANIRELISPQTQTGCVPDFWESKGTGGGGIKCRFNDEHASRPHPCPYKMVRQKSGTHPTDQNR
jgi:hypothetical protein